MKWVSKIPPGRKLELQLIARLDVLTSNVIESGLPKARVTALLLQWAERLGEPTLMGDNGS